jgi:hypothetical protein
MIQPAETLRARSAKTCLGIRRWRSGDFPVIPAALFCLSTNGIAATAAAKSPEVRSRILGKSSRRISAISASALPPFAMRIRGLSGLALSRAQSSLHPKIRKSENPAPAKSPKVRSRILGNRKTRRAANRQRPQRMVCGESVPLFSRFLTERPPGGYRPTRSMVSLLFSISSK